MKCLLRDYKLNNVSRNYINCFSCNYNCIAYISRAFNFDVKSVIIGILKKAEDVKELTGIGQEKEIVALAYNSALAKKVSNGDSTAIIAGDLNPELTNQGASADGSNPIKVTFTASKRQYTINSNGTIEYAGVKEENSDLAKLQDYFINGNEDAIEDAEASINWIDLNFANSPYFEYKNNRYKLIQDWENFNFPEEPIDFSVPPPSPEIKEVKSLSNEDIRIIEILTNRNPEDDFNITVKIGNIVNEEHECSFWLINYDEKLYRFTYDYYNNTSPEIESGKLSENQDIDLLAAYFTSLVPYGGTWETAKVAVQQEVFPMEDTDENIQYKVAYNGDYYIEYNNKQYKVLADENDKIYQINEEEMPIPAQ